MAGEKLRPFPHCVQPYRDDALMNDVLPFGRSDDAADPNMPLVHRSKSVLPFARFPGVDTAAGPEMRFNWRSHGLGPRLPACLPLKAQMGARNPLRVGCVFFSVKDMDSRRDATAPHLAGQWRFTLRGHRGTALG